MLAHERSQIELDVSDLAALVLHEERGASRVLNDLGAVREAVNDLAVLNGLDERGGLSLPCRTTVRGARTRRFPLGYSHDDLFSYVLNLQF